MVNYVLFDRDISLSARRVHEAFNIRLGRLGFRAELLFKDVKAPFGFDVDGIQLVVLSVDKPYPLAELEPAIRLEKMWGSVRGDLSRQTSHIAVGAPGKYGDFVSEKQRATLCTLLLAAIVETSKPIAVLWSAGSKLNKPDAILRASDYLQEGGIPVTAWISLSFSALNYKKEGPGSAVTTVGLLPFFQREVEVEGGNDLSDLAKTAFGVATYLLFRGPVLRNGETLEIEGGGKFSASLSAGGETNKPAVISLRRLTTN